MSQPSPDAKAVVRAAEALTTQVRRIADTLETPVVRYEVAADDGPTTPATTCSARYAGALAVGDCIRAAGHIFDTDHTDTMGRHYGDNLAVYPTDSTVRVAHWHPVAEQLAGERQELAGMVGEFIDAQMRMARPADEGDDAVAPTCWHTEPGSPCDWDRCHQPERLAAGDQGVDPATTPPLGPKLRAADEEGAPNMLRVLVDRSARGVLSPGEGDALRRRVEQLIAGRETWKAKAEEIERDRDQHAAVLRDILSRFRTVHDTTNGKVVGYDGPTIDPDMRDRWVSVIAPTVEDPWWETVAEMRKLWEQAQAASERVRAAVKWARHNHPGLVHVHDRLRAALDGPEQPTTERPDIVDQYTDPDLTGGH
jgi:hypothetical protein